MIQVGEEVRLRTKAGDYYQGLVFCVDKDKDVIILGMCIHVNVSSC